MNKKIEIGKKYRYVSGQIEEVVTIKTKHKAYFNHHKVYEARNAKGVYRICFGDELFEIQNNNEVN